MCNCVAYIETLQVDSVAQNYIYEIILTEGEGERGREKGREREGEREERRKGKTDGESEGKASEDKELHVKWS